MSDRHSYQTDTDHLSHRERSSGLSPKPYRSDSYASRGSRRHHSRSPSDRSNRPDQSVQSFSVRELAAESELSSRSQKGRHGRHSRRRRDRLEESYDNHSDDQYSSSYESEVSETASETESFSRSYASRSSPSVTQTSTSHASTHPKSPRFQGDVSEWGRKRMPHCKPNNSESEYTLSSGLSPRGSDGDARAEFDCDEAKRALAYNAGMYGRANAMRREGTAPRTMGIADDLPNRFALENLNALAGMASKVQLAIEHNRKVFANRVRMEDRAVLKKAFDAWRAARYGSVAKQQLLRRAIARLKRGLLSRAFQAWKDKFHLVDKFLAMRRKVTATIKRGRMKRAFQEWRRLCEERYVKKQLAARDAQIHALERKVDGFEKRPIVVLRRRKQSLVLAAWYLASEGRRRKRQRRDRAVMYWRNIAYLKAWNAWRFYTEECIRRKKLMKKVALKIKNIHMVSAWNKWVEVVLEQKQVNARMFRAMKHWIDSSLAKAWNTWWSYIIYLREKKIIINRWKNPLKGRALRGWIAMVEWRKRMRLILKRAAVRLKNRQLVMAWEAWFQAIEDRRMEETMTTKEQLLVAVKELREENERLRRDNERFVRLIDSGEWGRGRVAELVSAGEVLKGERDALLKLIQSLRREYEAVQSAKVMQDEEMRALKERMLLGGAARNRMLVKGGSSFNALVRAMKQDLVAGGAGQAARDPNLLYEVDKLSLNQVTVFPDGDIPVHAVASAPGAAAFARPLSAGRGLRHPPMNPAPPPGPVQQVRMPQGFAGGSPSRPLAVGAAAVGSGRPVNREEVVNRLSGLSKEELDNFERRLRAQKAAAAAAGAGPDQGGVPPRPPGVASSSHR